MSWEPEENLDFAETAVNCFITNLITSFVNENARLSKKEPPRKKLVAIRKPSENQQKASTSQPKTNRSQEVVENNQNMPTFNTTATAEIVIRDAIQEIKVEDDEVDVGTSVIIPENEILTSATATATATTKIGNSVTDNLLNTIVSMAAGKIPQTISAPSSENGFSNNFEMSDAPGSSSSTQNYNNIKQEIPETSEFDDEGSNSQIFASMSANNSFAEFQAQNESKLNFSLPVQLAQNQTQIKNDKKIRFSGASTSTDFGYAHFTSSKGGKHASIIYRSKRHPGTVIRYCFKSQSSDPNGTTHYICLGCKKLKMRNKDLPPIPRIPILDGKFLADPENTPERGHYCISYSMEDL
uniref:Uncharacterized protein n=1 Tax=Acrobeloides nanus TaxID=290746 RepID=A0A914DU98_9BILA